jgi:putative transcriptional regulator
MRPTPNARRPAKSILRAFAAAFLAAWLPPAASQSLDQPVILVAKPGAGAQAVGPIVLVVAPLGEGEHVGFVVNRPTEVGLGSLFPDHGPSQKAVDPVYLGGPIRPELIFALVQRRDSPGGKSLQIMPGLYAAYETPVVDRVIESDLEHARFVAGLVAWEPGELQNQVDLGAWIVLDADAAVAMAKPDGLWDALVRRWQQRMNSI